VTQFALFSALLSSSLVSASLFLPLLLTVLFSSFIHNEKKQKIPKIDRTLDPQVAVSTLGQRNRPRLQD
jgi:hypothetical protein